MPILAIRADAERLREIRAANLVHLSAQRFYDKIRVQSLGRDGEDEIAKVWIKATKVAGIYGNYANLTVVDYERVLNWGEASCVYYFLGMPGRWQRGVNTDNRALLPGWKPPPDEMTITVSGADVLVGCGDRIFYRPIDRAVVAFGDFRGIGRIHPAPHQT